MFLHQKETLHYNFFAHIRTVLFPNQSVTLTRKISLEQYNKAISYINIEVLELQKELDRLNTLSFKTGDPKDKIKADSLYRRISSYTVFNYHSRVLNYFSTIPNNQASFVDLIHSTSSSDIEIKYLRSTFTQRYFSRKVMSKPRYKGGN